MNEFAQQAEAMSPSLSNSVMSGFKPELLPVYTELANEISVFDKWFAFVPASTQPNRFYLILANEAKFREKRIGHRLAEFREKRIG